MLKARDGSKRGAEVALGAIRIMGYPVFEDVKPYFRPQILPGARKSAISLLKICLIFLTINRQLKLKVYQKQQWASAGMRRNHLQRIIISISLLPLLFRKYLEKRGRLEWVVTLGIQLLVLQ